MSMSGVISTASGACAAMKSRDLAVDRQPLLEAAQHATCEAAAERGAAERAIHQTHDARGARSRERSPRCGVSAYAGSRNRR